MYIFILKIQTEKQAAAIGFFIFTAFFLELQSDWFEKVHFCNVDFYLERMTEITKIVIVV